MIKTIFTALLWVMTQILLYLMTPTGKRWLPLGEELEIIKGHIRILWSERTSTNTNYPQCWVHLIQDSVFRFQYYPKLMGIFSGFSSGNWIIRIMDWEVIIPNEAWVLVDLQWLFTHGCYLFKHKNQQHRNCYGKFVNHLTNITFYFLLSSKTLLIKNS